MHDSSKVLLGSHGQSGMVSTVESGDPATFLAGLAVKRASTGALSLTTGSLIGVSLGRVLCEPSATEVARTGSKIPVRIALDVNNFNYVVVGAYVEFDASTGEAVASGTATQAIFVSGPMKGIDPITKAEVDVALVDFPGGL